MQEVINDYSFTEYLSVFVSILCGFVASQFLTGWGRILKNRKQVSFSISFIGLSFFFFILFIDFWWSSWKWYSAITQKIEYFFSFLTVPFIFYFISMILFPDIKTIKNIDLKTYLLKNTNWVFSLFILLMASSTYNSYVLLDQPIIGSENLVRLIGILASIAIIYIRSHLWLDIIVILGYLVFILNMVLHR